MSFVTISPSPVIFAFGPNITSSAILMIPSFLMVESIVQLINVRVPLFVLSSVIVLLFKTMFPVYVTKKSATL